MEGKIMKITESELRGKTVMSEEGLYLGILRNSTVDERTGKLAKRHFCRLKIFNQ